MHDQPTSCSTFNVMSLCKVRSFRRKKIVLCEEYSDGMVVHYVTLAFLSGSTLSTICIFFAVSFSTWHYVKYTVSKEKCVYFFQRPPIVKCLLTQYDILHQVQRFQIFLHNVLLFLNLVLDLYYIHNLHTYT